MTEKTQALRAVDKPFYRYWQAFYLSFFSSRLYVDVGKRWRGLGIVYLLLLMFVITIPFSIRIFIGFENYFTKQVISPMSQLPTLYIQNGQVSVDKPMPYLIKNDQRQVVAIIDTSGVIKTLNNQFPFASILITKDKFYYRMPTFSFFLGNNNVKTNSMIFEQDLSKQMNEVFKGDDWVKSLGIKKVKYLAQSIIYPIIALFFFGIYVILFLVLALLGQFISRLFFKFSINYAQSSRLLIVGATPALVLLLLAFSLNWIFPGLNFLLLILVFIYFCFAVFALMRESKKLVVS